MKMNFFGSKDKVEAKVANGSQQANVSVDGGYKTNTIVLKQGVPAKLTFNRKDPSSCLEQVIFPEFQIKEFLPQNEDHTIDIDTSKAGEYQFACGMDMFHGKVVVK